MWELDYKEKLSAEELMLLNCGVGEDYWESLGLQEEPTSPSSRRSVLGVHWKDWCWSWNSNTLATWCKELTHWKRPWWWERLRAGGEGDDRGWDGWMASPTWWTWVCASFGSCWWTGRPGVLQSMGSQRVRHDWVTELNGVYHCHFLYSGVFSCLKFDKSWNRVYLHYLNSWRQLGEYPKIIIKLTTIRKWKRK